MVRSRQHPSGWLTGAAALLAFMMMPDARGALLDSVSGSACSQTAGGAISGGQVICGFTAEQVDGLIAAAENRVREQDSTMRDRDLDRIEMLGRKLGASEEATENLLRLAGAGDVPPEKRRDVLARVVADYQKNKDDIAALQTDDPAARTVIDRAGAANNLGRFDEAKQLLAKASDMFAADAKASDEAVTRAALAAAAKRRAAADAKAAQAGIALTQRAYAEAAALFERASDLLPRDDTDRGLGLRFQAADALYRQGDEQGDNAALQHALMLYQALLVHMPRDRVPLDWAMMQVNIGIVLQTLGERESGTARLGQAVAAYMAALEETRRDRVPLGWARTQMGLGNALQTLGQRESGTARLEQAVTAYRAALEERTRDRVPLDWARTQMNLGNALSALGQRESGTARLEQAVAAYLAALEERTRDRVPLDWATTQMNLGNALWTLGQRESGTARLEQAVAAYLAALEEWTRDRVPLD